MTGRNRRTSIKTLKEELDRLQLATVNIRRIIEISERETNEEGR